MKQTDRGDPIFTYTTTLRTQPPATARQFGGKYKRSKSRSVDLDWTATHAFNCAWGFKDGNCNVLNSEGEIVDPSGGYPDGFVEASARFNRSTDLKVKVLVYQDGSTSMTLDIDKDTTPSSLENVLTAVRVATQFFNKHKNTDEVDGDCSSFNIRIQDASFIVFSYDIESAGAVSCVDVSVETLGGDDLTELVEAACASAIRGAKASKGW